MELIKKLLLSIAIVFLGVQLEAQTTPGITQVSIGGYTFLEWLPHGYVPGQLVNVMVGAPGEGEAAGPIAKDTINGSFASWSGRPGIRDTTSNATLDANLVVLWWNPAVSGPIPAQVQTILTAIRDSFNVNKLAAMGLSQGSQDWTNFSYYQKSNFDQINAYFVSSPEPANNTGSPTFGGGPIPRTWWALDSVYWHAAVATADPDGFFNPTLNTRDSIVASGDFRFPIMDSSGCACHSSTVWGPMFSPYVNQRSGKNIYQEFMTQYPIAATAAAPTFSPVAGAYGPSQSVTLASTTGGSTIYYTTDGSTPTTSSTIYTTAITVSTTGTVKAIAVASGLVNSPVASALYTINGAVATPTFSPIAGTYSGSQSVTISSTTTGSTFYYTLDGSTPTTSSTLYSSPVSISVNETLKALGTKTAFTNSSIGSAAYVITTPTAVTPTISPAAGTYVTTQSVTMSTSTPSSTMYYTLDGSTPTTSSTVYSGAFNVNTSEIVQAIAVSAGYNNSAVASNAYVINIVGPPKFKYTMSPGEYTEGFLDSVGHWHAISSDVSLIGANGAGTPGVPQLVTTIPANKIMAGVASGLHDASAWSADSGRVFFIGSNAYCQMGNGATTSTGIANELLVDSFGNQFYNVAQVSAGMTLTNDQFWYCAIKKNPGDTVWAWGNLTSLGRSTCQRPVPFILAGGKIPAKIYAYTSSIHVICTDGTVQVVGGNDDYTANTGTGTTPSQFTAISGLTNIAYIAKGYSFIFYITSTGDSVYGNGEYGWILRGGSSATFSPTTTPILLNTYLSSILPLDTLVAAHVAWMAIRSDSTLWTGGSNETGQCATGTQLNWSTYTTSPAPTGGTPAPWNWDVGMGEYVQAPFHVANGKHNFVGAFGGPLYSFHFFCIDAYGTLYFTGRDKAGIAGDGMVPAGVSTALIAAAYHMGWNHVNLMPVNPFTATETITTVPGCATGFLTGSPCSTGSDAPSRPNTNLNASLTATAVGNTIYLNNTASTTDGSHKIIFRIITQNSGTSLPLGIVAGQTDTIKGVSGGTYGFTQTIVDQSWDTATVTASVTVGATTPPTVSAGSNQAFILPTTSATLTGTATGNGGATITSTTWSQLSGPSSTIASPSSLTTAVSALSIVGVYVYQLSATDSNGNSSNSTMQITVTANTTPSYGPRRPRYRVLN